MWDFLVDVWEGDSFLGEGLGLIDGDGWGDGGDWFEGTAVQDGLDWLGDTWVGEGLGTVSELIDDSWVAENAGWLALATGGASALVLTAADILLDGLGFDEGDWISDDASELLGGAYDTAVISLASAGLATGGDVLGGLLLESAGSNVSGDGISSDIWGDLFDTTSDYLLADFTGEEVALPEATTFLDALASAETASDVDFSLFGTSSTSEGSPFDLSTFF